MEVRPDFDLESGVGEDLAERVTGSKRRRVRSQHPVAFVERPLRQTALRWRRVAHAVEVV